MVMLPVVLSPGAVDFVLIGTVVLLRVSICNMVQGFL